MSFILRLALVTWMTSALSPAKADEDDCPRWNCPCAGQTRLQEVIRKRQNNPHSVIVQSARQTNDKIRRLMNRIVEQRFRHNREHVSSLESCVHNRDQRCLGQHLERQCRLEGFPLMRQIQNVRFSEAALQSFMRDAKNLLSSLAVYVEQARLDEQSRVTDPLRSLAEDIRRIEEEGIYQILCSLQIAANYRNIPWDPTVARGVMLLGCQVFNTQAPIDNRNYMVFYTLEKLLSQMGRQALRKRNYPWAEEEVPLQQPLLPSSFIRADDDDDDDDNDGDDISQQYLPNEDTIDKEQL